MLNLAVFVKSRVIVFVLWAGLHNTEITHLKEFGERIILKKQYLLTF